MPIQFLIDEFQIIRINHLCHGGHKFRPSKTAMKYIPGQRFRFFPFSEDNNSYYCATPRTFGRDMLDYRRKMADWPQEHRCSRSSPANAQG